MLQIIAQVRLKKCLWFTPETPRINSSPERTRTSNLAVNSRPLCRLSYQGLQAVLYEHAQGVSSKTARALKNLSCYSHFKKRIAGAIEQSGVAKWTRDGIRKTTVPIGYAVWQSHFPKSEIASPKARNDIFNTLTAIAARVSLWVELLSA